MFLEAEQASGKEKQLVEPFSKKKLKFAISVCDLIQKRHNVCQILQQ